MSLNITGKPLRILLNFRDKNAAAVTDHSIPLTLLPPNVRALLQTPISQMIDTFWSGTKDSNGKTMRDRALAQTVAQIQAGARSAGQTATGITGTFPLTGTLSAEAQHGSSGPNAQTLVLLVYSMPGDNFEFNTGLAAWRVSFDMALSIYMTVPFDQPNPITAKGELNISNANISAANAAAALEEALATVGNFLMERPIAIFQGAEGQIDQNTGLFLGQLGTLLTQLNGPLAATVDQGFLKLSADVDGTGLFLRLIHLVDQAPVVTDATKPSVPTLQPPVLVTNQTQIAAGGQLTATGNYFTPAQATALHLQWNDTTSGTITESDIQWTGGGQTQNASIPRRSFDNGNNYAVTGVSPNTSYQVRVRDCDQLTCSDWSAPLSITTTGTDEVDIRLFTGANSVLLAKTTLATNGTFSVPITIPPGTPAGAHILRATVGGQTADTTITVFGAGQTVHPILEVINTDTGAVMPPPTRVVATYKVDLRGEGYAPGQVNLATDSGQQLGTATAGPNGIFSTTIVWPRGVTGNHQIVGSEVVSGSTVKAIVAVFAEALPT
jgi:hypothetical protein